MILEIIRYRVEKGLWRIDLDRIKTAKNFYGTY